MRRICSWATYGWGGALRLELGGSLSQATNTTLDVEGTTTLIAGDAITLNGNNNRFGDSVSVSGDQVQIRANDLLAFSGITAASLQATAPRLHLPATVNTLGLQRYDGAVTLLGDTRLSSDLGQIYFNGSIDGAHALTIERALEVVFNSTLGGSTALASLDTSGVSTTRLGGDISSSGTIALGGLSLWSTRGYSIASSGGDVRIGGAINGTADGQSSLSLRAAGALELQGNAGTSNGARLNDLTLRGASVAARALQTGGKLDIGSGAGFAQGGTLTAGGDAAFSAGNGGNLVLDDAANSFGGKVALQGNQAILRAQSSLAMDSVNVTQLVAYSNGNLSLANANVGTTAGLSAPSLHFANASINGALMAMATTGNISQGSGALSFGNNSMLSAGGDISLEGAANQFGEYLQLQARNARIATAGKLSLSHVTAKGLTASGDTGLQLNGRIVADNVDLATAGIFDNRTGANAIQLNGSGRWNIYLAAPDQAHVFGNLDSNNTALWNSAAFGGASAPGNRYLFAWQPALTVSAGSLRKIYGDSLDLGAAFSVQGLMAGMAGAYRGDTLAGLLSGAPLLLSNGAAATANASQSPYLIDISSGTLNTGASGYALAFAPGQLFVDRKALSITANDSAKTYGQSGGFGGFSSHGLVNDDSISGLDLSSSGSAATANVGDYAITANTAVGSGLSNYDIQYVDGTLSIGKAGLTITANNGGKTYGQTGGFNGFSNNGLLNNDSISGLDLTSNGSAATANVGNYTITANNAVGSGLSNYDISYVDGSLSIGKATLVITANDISKRIGQVLALDDFRSSGLLNGDSIDSVSLFSDGNNANAQPGVYTILAGNAQGARLGNYDISYQDGSLQIVGVSASAAAEIARAVVAGRNEAPPVLLPTVPPSLLPPPSSSGTSIVLPEGSCTQAGGMGCLTRQPE